MKCEFGCDGVAIHQFKNGRWCCHKTVNSCPSMRKKNAASNKTVIVDIEMAQALYDSGMSWRAVAKAINVSYSTLWNHNHLLKSRTRSDAIKLTPTHKHTQETKDRLSDVAKERGLGGYVPGSGRGKKGWYKGFFCDSSWELAYVMYCLDHNIKLDRNTEKFEYTFEGNTKNYIPDFICEGSYVEIKGFDSDEWKAKLDAFPHPIKVLYQDEINFYLDYAKNKYGKNFTDLYE